MNRFHFHRAWLPRSLFMSCSLALLLACFWPVPARAAQLPSGKVSLQIEPGFGNTYRVDTWTPVRITIDNHGPSVTGTLAVSAYAGSPKSGSIAQISPWSFEQHASIAAGAHQQFTFNLPFSVGNFTPLGFLVTLKDEQGHVLATDHSTTGYSVPPADLFLGWLSAYNSNTGPLSNMLLQVTLLNQGNSLTSSDLTAAIFPTQAGVLENFDVLVLDNFDTHTLSRQQLLALQSWVNQGGVLIEVGGAQWQRTLGALPSELLPVTPNGVQTLPAGTRLLPSMGTAQQHSSFNKPIVASTASMNQRDTFSNSTILLASGSTPLIVQSQQGQGTICYTAFDIADPSLLAWAGISDLWKTLLQHTLGDRLLIPNTTQTYTSGPGHLLTHGGLLTITEVAVPFNIWILALLLIGYILVIGPVRYLLVKRYHLPRGWGWRIFLASALVFSLLGYTIASLQRTASLTSNSISLVRFNQGSASSTTTHITTYMGLFVPNKGDLALNFPGNTLTQPLAGQSISRSSLSFTLADTSTTIEAQKDGTSMQMRGLNSWTFHPLVQEQDQQISGGLVTHLVLHDTTIEGTITNKLNTALNDVYVLLPHQFAHIARLDAGQTQQVKISLADQPQNGALADAIARQGGLTTPYFPYSKSQQPQNDFQRHAALLSALNGSGFTFQPCQPSCNTHAITDTPRSIIFTTGGNVPHDSTNNDDDPLLIPDAMATLIGWADQPLTDEATINGSHPAGRHESFIQAPLTIDLSQTTQVPAGLLSSRVVDIQGYDAQVILSGLYSLSTASVTFEMQAPGSLPASSYLITQPDLALQPDAQGHAPSGAPSHLRASLYNWHTGSWDPLSFKQPGGGALVTDATSHTGPGGRLLVQISSPDHTPVYFSKPLLAINTTH